MSDVGVSAEAALHALAQRAAALMAELAIKDVRIAELEQRLAGAEKGGGGEVVQP